MIMESVYVIYVVEEFVYSSDKKILSVASSFDKSIELIKKYSTSQDCDFSSECFEQLKEHGKTWTGQELGRDFDYQIEICSLDKLDV